MSADSPRFLAFDLETATDVPGDDFDWKPHRPLGITCAATFSTACAAPRVWYGGQTGGTPGPRMNRDEVAALVRFLIDQSAAGLTIVAWNGLGFDFDVLSEESGLPAECRRLALTQVDMMFHLFCIKGFPVGLDKAARGTGIEGKPAGMSGIRAPQLWKQGEHDKVLDYVAQDVRTTLNLAVECQRRRVLRWITQKGKPADCPLPSGWLSVEDAQRLPDPDTSWMDRPLSRAAFGAWATQ